MNALKSMTGYCVQHAAGADLWCGQRATWFSLTVCLGPYMPDRPCPQT